MEHSADASREQIESLRRDLDDKHRQNRGDIDGLREDQHGTTRELGDLKGRIEPYLDNGKKGLFSRMSEQLDRLRDGMEEISLTLAREKGRRDAFGFFREALKALIIGLLIVAAQHLWK
jgi:chromosome segregation ATPase